MENKKRITVLNRRSEFLKIKKIGQRVYPSKWLIMNFVKTKDGGLRCGWTITRKIGNAVVRNKLKRWCREFFQGKAKQELLPVKKNIEINVVVKKIDKGFYKSLRYSEFENILEKGWKLIK